MIDINIKIDDRIVPLVDALTALITEHMNLMKGPPPTVDEFKQDLRKVGNEVQKDLNRQAKIDGRKDSRALQRETTAERAAAAEGPPVTHTKADVIAALKRVIDEHVPEKGSSSDTVKKILAEHGGGASSTGALAETYYAAVIAAADALVPPADE